MPVLIPNPRQKPALAAFLTLVLFAGGGMPPHARAEISKEYQVKAVFLFNFAQFVEWPSNAFGRADEPFCIGILGEDPFDAFLDETVKGEKVGGRPLVIQRFGSVVDIKKCQVLFISRSESGRMGNILADLKGRDILTVGDTEGFLKNGGIIRFVTEGNKVHFRINPDAAKRVRLTISSKVLRLAEISRPGED